MIVTLGDVVEDIVVRLSGPIAHGTDTPSVVDRRRGGSAANTAVMVAALDRPARFVGVIGDDALGQRLVDDLRAAGVDWRGQRRGRSASIVVLVDPDGERSMLTDRGDADTLGTLDPIWLDDLTALHVPAYSLAAEPLATTAVDAIADARRWGALVSIDVSSVDLIERQGPAAVLAQLDALRPDVVLANGDEFDALGGPSAWADAPHTPLVVKRGPDPALVVRGESVVEVPAPAPRHDGVDTTGAGDAFAAGLIVAMIDGADLTAAAAAGHAAAAQWLETRPGIG